MNLLNAAAADDPLTYTWFAGQATDQAGSPARPTRSAAANDNRASDVRLDQFYTHPDVARHFYRIFQEHFDPASLLMVEPSAGTGAFFAMLPPGSLGFDLEPKYPGIYDVDFLGIELESNRTIGILGNPPFGKNASTAVRFFNQGARWSSVIGFIVPRTFRKASIENRLDRAFHLVREEPVPNNAFLFRAKPYDVPAIFQIWVRGNAPRALRDVETSHPDFEFTTFDLADFAIQRVGARAGRVHHDLAASPSSHYFIRCVRGDVEAVMARLNFAAVARDVAGNPSLAKSEIISLYREWTEPPAPG